MNKTLLQFIKLFFLIVFLSACDDKNDITVPSNSDNNIKKLQYTEIGFNCLNFLNEEYIIKTESEFLEMVHEYYNEDLGSDCVDTTHSPFSFNEFYLLGKFVSWDLNDTLTKELLIDSLLKKVIYKIDLDKVDGYEYEGKTSSNWIKMPKVPDDYDITIEYTEK